MFGYQYEKRPHQHVGSDSSDFAFITGEQSASQRLGSDGQPLLPLPFCLGGLSVSAQHSTIPTPPPLHWRLLTTDAEYREAGMEMQLGDYTPAHLVHHIVPTPNYARFAYRYSKFTDDFKDFTNNHTIMEFQGFAIVSYPVLAMPEEEAQMKEFYGGATHYYVPVHNISICKYREKVTQKDIIIAGPEFISLLRVLLNPKTKDLIEDYFQQNFGQFLSEDENVTLRKRLLGALLTTFFQSIEDISPSPAKQDIRLQLTAMVIPHPHGGAYTSLVLSGLDAFVFKDMIGEDSEGNEHYLYCFAHGTGVRQVSNRAKAERLHNDESFKKVCWDIMQRGERFTKEELKSGKVEKDPFPIYSKCRDTVLLHLVRTIFPHGLQN